MERNYFTVALYVRTRADSTDLYAYFGQCDLGGELLATVDVRVVRLVERLLELVQLVRGERRPVAPVLLAGCALAAQVLVVNVDLLATTTAQHHHRSRLPLAAAVRSALCRPAEKKQVTAMTVMVAAGRIAAAAQPIDHSYSPGTANLGDTDAHMVP